MYDQREPTEVRRARADLARRVAEHLRHDGPQEQQRKVIALEPKPTGLDAWLKANERSTRR